MKERIEDKMEQIEEYLEDLSSFKPKTFEEYRKSTLIKAASERLVEKIAEALVDLAVLIIRFYKLDSPEDDDTSFQILSNNMVIKEILATRLRELKGMRNRLAHQYGTVEDRHVFKAIDEELERDAHDFIESLRRKMHEPKNA